MKGRRMIEARVRRAATVAFCSAGYPPEAAEVFFLTEQEMRILKFHTTGKKVRTVNVLAFESPSGFPHPEQKVFLGEIYVNGERYATNPSRMLFLVIHGFLHLIGFRHEKERDTITMRRMERKLVVC